MKFWLHQRREPGDPKICPRTSSVLGQVVGPMHRQTFLLLSFPCLLPSSISLEVMVVCIPLKSRVLVSAFLFAKVN